MARGKPKIVNIEVEIGEGMYFDVVEEIDGFWISYDSEEFEGWKPFKSDLRWVVRLIKKIMRNLSIQAPHFALHLVLFGDFVNPNCFVDKRKEVIYLRLPINVVDGCLSIPSEVHEDYILYHELMHAKDCLEGRFPSGGFFDPYKNPELGLIISLWHFSIERRLEKNGKPHKARQKVVEEEFFWASGLLSRKKFITGELFQKLCDKLWGKEVTFRELKSLLENEIRRY